MKRDKNILHRLGFDTCEDIPTYEMDDGVWGWGMLFWILAVAGILALIASIVSYLVG
jgi:hypothetical protein